MEKYRVDYEKRLAYLEQVVNGELKAFISVANPGAGNIYSIQQAIPNIHRIDMIGITFGLEFMKELKKAEGKIVLLDIWHDQILSADVANIIKALVVDQKAMYRSANDNIDISIAGIVIACRDTNMIDPFILGRCTVLDAR